MREREPPTIEGSMREASQKRHRCDPSLACTHPRLSTSGRLCTGRQQAQTQDLPSMTSPSAKPLRLCRGPVSLTSSIPSSPSSSPELTSMTSPPSLTLSGVGGEEPGAVPSAIPSSLPLNALLGPATSLLTVSIEGAACNGREADNLGTAAASSTRAPPTTGELPTRANCGGLLLFGLEGLRRFLDPVPDRREGPATALAGGDGGRLRPEPPVLSSVSGEL